MHNISPTHYRTIDEKPLWVIDDIATSIEVNNLFLGLEASAFKRNERARPDTSAYIHWALNLQPDQFKKLPFYTRLIESVARLTEKEYRVYRGYVNYASYGDMLFTHTDCLPENDEMTVLMFVAPKWDIEWGGETMFYNKYDDCEFACTPKPGRIVIFHGAIKHAGRPPSKICVMPRYTLAFKLEPSGAIDTP